MSDLALLTPAELCERLKISRRTYARLLAKGLPCRLVLSGRRFVWADVLAWLPKGQQQTASATPSGFVDMGRYLKHKAANWRR